MQGAPPPGLGAPVKPVPAGAWRGRRLELELPPDSVQGRSSSEVVRVLLRPALSSQCAPGPQRASQPWGCLTRTRTWTKQSLSESPKKGGVGRGAGEVEREKN